MRDVLDALQSFEAASIEVDDVVAAGKGEPTGKPFTAKIARAGMRKLAARVPAKCFSTISRSPRLTAAICRSSDLR